MDKSVYMKFGKIDPAVDPNAHQYAVRYGHILGKCKFKDEFDTYKGAFRFAVKRQCMAESYHELKKKVNRHQRNPIFINFASVPFLKAKFQSRHFKLTTDHFLIILGMYNTYLQAVKFWKIHSISYNLVNSFGGPYSKDHYKIVIAKMLQHKMIRPTTDQDMYTSILKRMANQHKHPVIGRILKEDHYMWTTDGKRIIEGMSRDQLDFLDQMDHNATFFQQANIPAELRDSVKAAKKILTKKEPAKRQKAMNNERRNAI